jgi:toxin ParE1/3/4
MAQIIWTEPARMALDSIADYIALENQDAARFFVQRVSSSVKQLVHFPRSGSRIPEAPRKGLRQLVIKPCRVFYRIKGNDIIILCVMRTERLFRKEFLQ